MVEDGVSPLMNAIGKCATMAANEIKELKAERDKLLLQIDELKEAVLRVIFKANDGHYYNTFSDGVELELEVPALKEALEGKQTEKRDIPVPIRRGCICGPDGMCDYHTVTDVTALINQMPCGCTCHVSGATCSSCKH